MKKIYLIIIMTLFIFSSCEDNEKETTITITSPQDGSTIYETVPISFDISNTDGIDQVELWVNNIASGVIDTTKPFSLEWNTSSFEDLYHQIKIRAYHSNGDTIDSEPITLAVSNEQFRPNSVTITSITYDDGMLSIDWSQNDDDDFKSYILFESDLEDMNESYDIMSTQLQTYTNHSFSRELMVKYYQVVVEDITGLKSFSNIVKGSSFITFKKVYDESSYDQGLSGHQTTDGGYITLGSIKSDDRDYLLIKTDAEGEEEWSNNLGNAAFYYFGSVNETTDGGYIVAGGSRLIKTGSEGQEEWSKTFGINIFSASQTTDGGYIMTGMTELCNDSFHCIPIIKTDLEGQVEWEGFFEDGIYTSGFSVKQTDDGGYIISGSYSEGPGYVQQGAYLVKTDSQGYAVWKKIFYQYGTAYHVQQTTDGGYIMSGSVVTKINSIGEEEWHLDYYTSAVQQTADNGFIITSRHSFDYYNDLYNIRLIKINYYGQEEWIQDIPGLFGKAIDQTTDGGYYITGYEYMPGSSSRTNLLIIKTDSKGGID